MQNEVEVMRAIRVPPMGALVVHADNGRFKHIRDVRNEQTRQRLLAAIGELVSFAGGYDALVEAGVAPHISAPQAADSDPSGENDAELERRRAAFLEQLERNAAGGTMSDPRENPALPGTLTDASPTGAGLDTSAPAGGINLVAAIDRILQKHVATNEQLARRTIHLRQSPGQALQIVVDNKVYEHPNDIEDEEVRRVLKQALREWETR